MSLNMKTFILISHLKFFPQFRTYNPDNAFVSNPRAFLGLIRITMFFTAMTMTMTMITKFRVLDITFQELIEQVLL